MTQCLSAWPHTGGHVRRTRRTGPPRALLLIALTAGLCASRLSPAAGHGVVEGSDPPANAALDAAPRQIVLKVTEPVGPAFSSVVVLDKSGRRISGATAVSPDGRRMTASLATLGRGAFLVKWRSLSRLDGHTSSGAFLFTVGQAPPQGAAAAGGGAAVPDRLFVIVRWITLLLATLLAGTTFFPSAVLQRALRALSADEASRIAMVASRRLRMLTLFAALALMPALVIEALLQWTALLDAPLSQQFASGLVWVFVFATRPGWSAVIGTVAALMLLLPPNAKGWLRPAALLRPEPYVLGGLVLAGQTLTAHAAAAGPIGLLADLSHLLAIAVWIGGLASLLVVLRGAAPADRGPFARALAPRFSAVAGVSLGVVVATGLYSTWLNVPSLRAFTATPYGRGLLVKFALVVCVVALGAVNRFVFVPRIGTRAENGWTGSLARFLETASGEIAVGAGILLVVAIVTAMPTPRATQALDTRQPLVLAAAADNLHLRLTITPAQPGWNRFEAAVTDRENRPVALDARVMVRLVKLDQRLDPTTASLAHQGQGRYVAEGGQLAVSGWWQMDAIVRRRGRLDVATTFPLFLGQTSVASDPPAVRLLNKARSAINTVRAWRETEQLTSGTGPFLLTQYDLEQPDRLRFRRSDGGEAVVIGEVRYDREQSGPWKKVPFVRLRVTDGVAGYMIDPVGVTIGREVQCEGETCDIVMWSSSDGSAHFAASIGRQRHLTHRLLMAAPGHYMTLWVRDFDAPIHVAPPRECLGLGAPVGQC